MISRNKAHIINPFESKNDFLSDLRACDQLTFFFRPGNMIIVGSIVLTTLVVMSTSLTIDTGTEFAGVYQREESLYLEPLPVFISPSKYQK